MGLLFARSAARSTSRQRCSSSSRSSISSPASSPSCRRSSKWRFASSALFAGFLLTPLLGVALAMIVAGLMNHRVRAALDRDPELPRCRRARRSSVRCSRSTSSSSGPSAESEVRNAIVLSGVRAIFKNLVMSGSLLYIGLACRSATGEHGAAAGRDADGPDRGRAPALGRSSQV